METETHFIDAENHIYRTKIDLLKESGQMIGFKVVCWERVVECHLDDENNPTFKVRKLGEDDKNLILKEGFKNVGKQWTNGDIKKTSKKLNRTEKSVWMKKIPQRPPKPNKNKGKVWMKDEGEKLINLYEKYDGDIVKISKEMKR